jgi:hypothetical protein
MSEDDAEEPEDPDASEDDAGATDGPDPIEDDRQARGRDAGGKTVEDVDHEHPTTGETFDRTGVHGRGKKHPDETADEDTDDDLTDDDPTDDDSTDDDPSDEGDDGESA